MNFDSGRIFLEPEPQIKPAAVHEVVAIGHTGAAADLSWLLNNQKMLQQMASAGYVEKINQLRQKLADGEKADDLFDIPVPLSSLAEFESLFRLPPVAEETQPYASTIAGTRKWLPLAVRDFFIYQQQGIARKLWVIAVDPNSQQQAFLPGKASPFLEESESNAFLAALALPQAALLIVPDYERLQIPSNLEGKPRLRIPNPAPAFLPCSANEDDGISERNMPGENISYPDVESFGDCISEMLSSLARHRPDLRLMLSLPYDERMNGEQPQASREALKNLESLKRSQFSHSLHKLQLLFPYLLDRNSELSSASGLLAGLIASQSVSKGAWKSVAGINLPGDYEPWPNLPQKKISFFRDDAGIGVLRMRVGQMQLDDERLAAGVFSHRSNTITAELPDDASGEISRFMGWLYRSLENLGMELVFDVASGSRKAFIRLNDFFTDLYQLGALRGASVEQAYSIKQINNSDAGTLVYNIAIAPAFPIDRINISINRDGVDISYA